MKKRVLAAVLGLIVTVTIPFVMERAIPEPIQELNAIRRDIRNMGYTLEDVEFIQKGDADFANRATYLASSRFRTTLQPGDFSLSIYQYESEEELEKGMESYRMMLTLASILGRIDLYCTTRNFIVCYYRSEQAEFYQPLQEYLENLTEGSQQK
ncbi:MAG TPA: hypothetical protein IAC82_08450 [Candidatus Merdivicinus intestinigallinarum]|nr:hypothetical protein [Candidatus Merdivicinus intestinigallinarum]